MRNKYHFLFLVLISFKTLFTQNNHLAKENGERIYRKLDKVALVVYGVVGGILSVPGYFLIKESESGFDFKEPIHLLCAMPPLMAGYGCLKFLRSWALKKKPIMRITDKGLYYEKNGFYSWDELGAPLIVEETYTLYVLRRDIWIPISDKKNKYIKIDPYELDIYPDKLLSFMQKHKPMKSFSLDSLWDEVPLHMQATVTPELRKSIEDFGAQGSSYKIFNCITPGDHECLMPSGVDIKH